MLQKWYHIRCTMKKIITSFTLKIILSSILKNDNILANETIQAFKIKTFTPRKMITSSTLYTQKGQHLKNDNILYNQKDNIKEFKNITFTP